MAKSTYGFRPRERLDYAVLHTGKQVQFPAFGFSPGRSEEQHPDPYSPVLDTSHEQHDDSISTDFATLQQQLESAKAANAVLEHSTKMEQMRRELEGLRARNAELEKTFAPPQLHDGETRPPHTLPDLRQKASLTARVDQFLAKLDQSSTDESDGEEKQSSRKSRGRRHSLKLGKASKLTSRVVTPQLWPHSHLSLSYISKEKKYDDLTLAEFAGGYAAILQRPDLSPVELRARIEHLSSLMYLATQFTWPSVRELHAAVLFEIECGRARWGDSFTHLENRILQPSSWQSRAGATRTENSAAVFFCRDFQHGVCKFSKDHYGTLHGERKWFQHICARCWVDSRVSARHTEFSKDCPLKGEMPKAAGATETSA